MNKYEMVLISAREARRMNEVAKLSGRDLKIRPTMLAWNRLSDGKIKYTYEAEPLESQAPVLDTGVADPGAEPPAESGGTDESA